MWRLLLVTEGCTLGVMTRLDFEQVGPDYVAGETAIRVSVPNNRFERGSSYAYIAQRAVGRNEGLVWVVSYVENHTTTDSPIERLDVYATLEQAQAEVQANYEAENPEPVIADVEWDGKNKVVVEMATGLRLELDFNDSFTFECGHSRLHVNARNV